MLKKLKTFNYDDKNYVILKDHSCSNSRAQLIGIDTDLSAELLFCEDFHPGFASSTCEFRAIAEDRFDPQMGLEYYLDEIEDLLAIEVHDKIING